MPRKRGPGRPALGADARSVSVAVRLTQAQYDAIETYVAKENAEIKADPSADAIDRKPATVSSWLRDVIDDAILTVSPTQ